MPRTTTATANLADSPLRRRRFRLMTAALFGIALMAALCAQAVHAQEAAIRKTLGERAAQFKNIDEVRTTPIPGVYEVRVGSDLFYTDAKGDYLLQGELIDTKAQTNLTQQRIDKLTQVPFKDLPSKDAFTIVRGNGKRQLAVFEDPNCGYCHRFEADLQKVTDVTVHLYLYPILGPDSVAKAKAIWCAADKGKIWQDWMLRSVPIPQAECNFDALKRNVAFGQKYKINGTPTLILADGSRVPGAIDAAMIEKALAAGSATVVR